MVACPKTHRPDTALDEIREFFEDDHVHMALIVTADQRLLTTMERSDLATASSPAPPARDLGRLVDRTVSPSAALDAVTARLLREGRRRFAVVDSTGRLLGLLCLKRDGTGYRSDAGIRERATANTTTASSHSSQIGTDQFPEPDAPGDQSEPNGRGERSV
jgi:hypothetical protein